MKTIVKLSSLAALCAVSLVACKKVKKSNSSRRTSPRSYPCKAYHSCVR